MNNRTRVQLTDEKLQEIYTSEKFRNDVAYAHGYTLQNGETGLKTCSYPIEYIVTPEQVEIAAKEQERRKKEVLNALGNKLVFVGMGMSYAPRYDDDVCNHRIRTYFVNSKGNKYFIEFGTGNGDNTRIDHAIDETKRELADSGGSTNGEWINNFNGLERRDHLPKYTLSNLLNLINKEFDCKFTTIEVDDYNLTCSDFICNSPKS